MVDPASHACAIDMRFSKMHGAGNDFVVLDLRGGSPPPTAATCRALADRKTGVGCDQILTVEPPRSNGAIASYRVWNADGSSSQQCGNGARCVAAWLVRDRATGSDGAHVADTSVSDSFVLDSPAGAHAVTRLAVDRFRIAMGVPDFAPESIPMQGVRQASRYTADWDRSTLSFGAVSMGNPHAVVEVGDVDVAPVASAGAWLQSQPLFPESVNVGFAQVESRRRVRLRVYERGVGETLACGSGACAAAAVLMRDGRIEREVTVVLPGGELQIDWPADDAPLCMAGPATFVFEGEWLQ